ncbi:CmcI family methyltransferase [Breoghania sp.]|uniref:cephalosporin hydroxylase family protein n=1 Tax=Breoghania sp. TaxID=2065378 RepID=UPI0029CA52E9|nr:CmcI family methyltransferase [Breoghania sp.]
MKLVYDEEKNSVSVTKDGETHSFALDTPEAFEAMSHAWLRAGWDTKYVYSFAWFGRPVIQLPEDMIRIQEVIWQIKPTVIVETGVAHGGSLIFYATLFKAMERGKVIGVELALRDHNREAIAAHDLSEWISIVDGSSTAPESVDQVRAMISPEDTVLVILDSNHTREHVLNELRAYADVVTPGSYIVATDGIMEQVAGAPRSADDWKTNNPKQAALDFVKENENFVIEEPVWPFNEGVVRERVTYWPSAYVKRIK